MTKFLLCTCDWQGQSRARDFACASGQRQVDNGSEAKKLVTLHHDTRRPETRTTRSHTHVTSLVLKIEL